MSKFNFQIEDYDTVHSLTILTHDYSKMLVTVGEPGGGDVPFEFHVWPGAGGDDVEPVKVFRIGNRDIEAVWTEAVAAAYSLAVTLA